MYASHNKHLPLPYSMDTSTSKTSRVRCANCDIEILWPATVVQEKAYCCTGCAVGGPCNCDYSLYRSVYISGVIHYRIEREHER